MKTVLHCWTLRIRFNNEYITVRWPSVSAHSFGQTEPWEENECTSLIVRKRLPHAFTLGVSSISLSSEEVAGDGVSFFRSFPLRDTERRFKRHTKGTAEGNFGVEVFLVPVKLRVNVSHHEQTLPHRLLGNSQQVGSTWLTLYHCRKYCLQRHWTYKQPSRKAFDYI